MFTSGEKNVDEDIVTWFNRGLTFAEIQLKVGNKSKKYISEVIRKKYPDISDKLGSSNWLRKWREERFEEYKDDWSQI